MVEAAQNIGRSFINPASSFTKGLLTVIVALSTYFTANTLRGFRNKTYLSKSIRKNLSNFGPTLGVAAGALIAHWAKLSQGTSATLPALAIPPTFATTSGRPWLVPLMDLPVWARWAAFFPALMATVLLFLDQNITVRLVNISHVRALSKFDSATGKLKRTIEQRVTGFSIHALIGACVLLDKPRAVLTQLPTPVLMGLFLFLGMSALPGNEMWERIKELFKDPKISPKERWSAVPKKVTTMFTLIQIACLGAMVKVMKSQIGVLFPVIIALLAPLRFALEKSGVIKKEDMDILDDE